MLKEEPLFNFSADKNALLIKERNISFEEIIAAIEDSKVLSIVEHPNKKKFCRHKMYIVHAHDYVYLVPFIVEIDGSIFLKTIIPSRKAKKQYLNTVENRYESKEKS